MFAEKTRRSSAAQLFAVHVLAQFRPCVFKMFDRRQQNTIIICTTIKIRGSECVSVLLYSIDNGARETLCYPLLQIDEVGVRNAAVPGQWQRGSGQALTPLPVRVWNVFGESEPYQSNQSNTINPIQSIQPTNPIQSNPIQSHQSNSFNPINPTLSYPILSNPTNRIQSIQSNPIQSHRINAIQSNTNQIQ
jgi:hypothetical protein